MKVNFTKEIMPSDYQRFYFTGDKANKAGETLLVEITEVHHDLKDKKSLMNLWVKEGYLDKPIKAFWSISTYVNDSQGNCYGKYNPQHYSYKKLDSKGKVVISNMRIKFSWVLPATEENLEIILNECARQFMEMVATEKVVEVEK